MLSLLLPLLLVCTSDAGQQGCAVPVDSSRAQGSWGAPIEVQHTPAVDRWDSQRSQSAVAKAYDCAPNVPEHGPEVVYRFTTARPGAFVAELRSAAGADIDLHLLQDPQLAAGLVTGCVARAHERLELAALPAGTWWLVADSYGPGGQAAAGAYELAFEWTPQGPAAARSLAEGVSWERQQRGDPGERQTVNLLRLAPGAAARLEVYKHDGCQPVSEVAGDLGALAGTNGGFFSPACQPLDLLKAHGAALSLNHMDKGPQRSLGWTDPSARRWAWVDEGTDWPGVTWAVGGHPSLVEDGQIALQPAGSNGFYRSRHPRTALGTTADGGLLLVTVDGRTAAGAGMTLEELAALMLELGAVQAVNLDGGGSTTMVVRDCWIDGVVNHPSDNQAADHRGERAVSDGLYLIPVSR